MHVQTQNIPDIQQHTPKRVRPATTRLMGGDGLSVRYADLSPELRNRMNLRELQAKGEAGLLRRRPRA